MTRYRLRDGLHFCTHQGRTIFLDAEAGRYFGLPQPMDAAFQRLCIVGELTRAEDEAMAPMVTAGLLLSASAACSISPLEIPPAVQAGEGPQTQARAHIVWHALAAQLSAAMAQRTRSFAALKCAIVAAKPRVTRRQQQVRVTHSEIGSAFEATTLIFRSADRCLPQSIAYLSVCRKMGLDPRLIFGVRLNPFAAHCWVQHGNRVVYDTIKGAHLYTPILAL